MGLLSILLYLIFILSALILVVVILLQEGKGGGFGGELAALVQERCFYHLESPVERVAGWDTPYPHAFEWDYFPGPARLAKALVRAMEA